jgi:hypothetical protein
MTVYILTSGYTELEETIEGVYATSQVGLENGLEIIKGRFGSTKGWQWIEQKNGWYTAPPPSCQEACIYELKPYEVRE